MPLPCTPYGRTGNDGAPTLRRNGPSHVTSAELILEMWPTSCHILNLGDDGSCPTGAAFGPRPKSDANLHRSSPTLSRHGHFDLLLLNALPLHASGTDYGESGEDGRDKERPGKGLAVRLLDTEGKV